jgi:hypothetical protein
VSVDWHVCKHCTRAKQSELFPQDAAAAQQLCVTHVWQVAFCSPNCPHPPAPPSPTLHASGHVEATHRSNVECCATPAGFWFWQAPTHIESVGWQVVRH